MTNGKDWNFLMCKCLSSMGERESMVLKTFVLNRRQRFRLRMGDLLLQVFRSTLTSVFEVGRLPKPHWRIRTFSMSQGE